MPLSQGTRPASLLSNNQILKIEQKGKESLVYSIAKPEEVEDVADFAEKNYYNLTPVREMFVCIPTLPKRSGSLGR